jgi:hypothetical protein
MGLSWDWHGSRPQISRKIFLFARCETGLYGEIPRSFEKNFSGLMLGGEIQVPVDFSESTSDLTSISSYGTLGSAF